MSLTDLVRRAFLAGALATASVGAGAVALSVPAVAEAKQLEELTPSNFAKKVYHNPKPVVVLFYEEGDGVAMRGESTVEPSRRMEKVVEELADKYKWQVAFFRVAIDHDGLTKSQFERVFDVPDYSPLTVMYGRFDVLTGKQSPHNFKIDVARGGPLDDTSVRATAYNTDLWIQQNLFGRNPEGDGKLYRYEDALKIHEVGTLR